MFTKYAINIKIYIFYNSFSILLNIFFKLREKIRVNQYLVNYMNKYRVLNHKF